MNLKIKVLTIVGSLMLMAFVVNVGTASADGAHLGPDPNNLANSGAAGPNIVPAGSPGHAGAHNGFNYSDETGFDWDNPAVIAITRNPLCGFHPID